jgi:membrane protease YdiL (CAAX protease family)
MIDVSPSLPMVPVPGSGGFCLGWVWGGGGLGVLGSGAASWWMALVMVVLAPVVLVVSWRKGWLRASGSPARAAGGGGEGDAGGEADPAGGMGLGAAAWLLAGFAVLVLQGLVIQLVRAMVPVSEAGRERADAVAVLVAGVVAGGLGLLVLAKLEGLRGGAAGLGGVLSARGLTSVLGGWRDVWIGLGAIVLAWPVVSAASLAAVWVRQRVAGEAPDPIAHSTLKTIVESENPWKWGLVAGAVLAAPVVEEIIYRGGVQRAFRHAGLPAWGAIGVTSALFAAAHAGGTVPWHALITLLVLSLGLGLVYERRLQAGGGRRRGALLAPMAMHAGFNAANIALAVVVS